MTKKKLCKVDSIIIQFLKVKNVSGKSYREINILSNTFRQREVFIVKFFSLPYHMLWSSGSYWPLNGLWCNITLYHNCIVGALDEILRSSGSTSYILFNGIIFRSQYVTCFFHVILSQYMVIFRYINVGNCLLPSFLRQ